MAHKPSRRPVADVQHTRVRPWPWPMLALLLWGFLAPAGAACPPWPSGGLDALGDQGRAAEIDRLMALEARCADDADYYARRGALLLGQGRYLDAARDLEHALLLNPRHGGAAIDYALTLEAQGERESARAMVEALRLEPGLPPHIATLLAALGARLAEPSRPSAGADAEAQDPGGWLRATLLAGYSTNRNAAPTAETLTLTLPQAEIEVGLAPNSRPSPGPLALLSLDAMPRPLDLGGGASLALLVQLSLRAPPQGQSGRLAQGRLEAVRAQGGAGTLDLLGIGLEALDAVPGGTQAELEVYGERRWLGGGCTPGLRLGLRAERWPQSIEAGAVGLAGIPYLDGIEPRLTARLLCGDTDLAAYLGHLLAREGRAGGDADRLGLRLGRRWSLPLGRLDLYGEASYLGDREGYSPWLEHGARRRIGRLDLGLEWEAPLRGGWGLVVRAEHLDQWSNLPLFDVRETAFFLGLRR